MLMSSKGQVITMWQGIARLKFCPLFTISLLNLKVFCWHSSLKLQILKLKMIVLQENEARVTNKIFVTKSTEYISVILIIWNDSVKKQICRLNTGSKKGIKCKWIMAASSDVSVIIHKTYNFHSVIMIWMYKKRL